MGPEGNAAPSSSSAPASLSVKRGRDPEDEVYVDNLHSHKRYLSECTFQTDFKDEISVPYSPMSEDSDESRYYESWTNGCSSQPESAPTSPVSPYRCQKSPSGFMPGPPTTSYPSHSGVHYPVAMPQPCQCGSDPEGRFPSSPSDICHSADLRRAVLLRSVQMRAQPAGSLQFELPLSRGHDSANNIEAEEQPCSYMKLDVDDRGYQIGECTALSISERENEKTCRTLAANLKGDESADK